MSLNKLYVLEQRIAQLERQLLAAEKNAARYLWLRKQLWHSSKLFVVSGSRSQIKLGTNCPNLGMLDNEIDDAMREENDQDTK